MPLGYFRTYTYHPYAYQPQQQPQQQYAPSGIAPMTNYQVTPPRQLPNNFSTRQLSPQQPSFTRNLAEPLVTPTPSTPVKDPETKPLTDSSTTTATATASASATTTTNSETNQLPPLPVPQQQQPQQPFHFKPNQMPTHSNFMQQQNPMNMANMGQMSHMGQMNNHMSHMMMKPQQQQPQQQSQQQFSMPDPVNLQYMTNVAPLSVQNIQFVPCMCPVSVTMTPEGPVPTVDKRSDDSFSYDNIQDVSLDENL